MNTKKYVAKKGNSIKKTDLWKYLSNIEEMYKNINIQAEDDIEDIIDELEEIYTNLYKKFELSSNKYNNSLKWKLFENRLLRLDEVITSVRVIEANFRNDEECIEDDEEDNYDEVYESLIDDAETDVVEALLCI